MYPSVLSSSTGWEYVRKVVLMAYGVSDICSLPDDKEEAQFSAACVNESAERKDAASGQAVVGSGGKVKFLDGHVQ